MNKEILYFDASATVPMKPEVIEEVYDKMKTIWGNPSSEHSLGTRAKELLESSRHTVASYMNCDPEEIIFTGSASASNNLAIKGFCKSNKVSCIITNLAEHKSVLSSCENIKEEGYVENVFYLRLDGGGHIDLDRLRHTLQFHYNLNPIEFKSLVSISLASSEIGVIQDIHNISSIVHEFGSILHVDGTQCFTRFPIELKDIDLFTASGSKIGAGKGIGILYKKKHIHLTPLIHGGHQEYGLIAGTEDVPKICGFAKAVSEADYKPLYSYRDYFFKKIEKTKLDYRINGDMTNHLDNHISISFKNRKADAIVSGCANLGLCISAGSACNSGETLISPAIEAIQVPEEYAAGTVRITLPQNVTFEQIDTAIKILVLVVDNGN